MGPTQWRKTIREVTPFFSIVTAFSAGIVSNPAMRYQLYQSPSAAHAHKVLNPRGDIDFNCFLDETLIASNPPPAPLGLDSIESRAVTGPIVPIRPCLPLQP